ncbi:MAG: phenylalanine--tRNA ligase subunit alpha [Saprospiraceae bacterium]|nr:phenylalanine--tRNA ligase subunit alpha [Saprospiraceae bacterium]
MSETYNKIIEEMESQIESFAISTKEELEAFRIAFLGSKNKLKDLFALMGKVAAEERKNFGQALNKLKSSAEAKFAHFSDSISNTDTGDAVSKSDLTRPGFPTPLGTRHPVSQTLNRIIEIFTKIGFTVEENREIEDEWHNFTALNTPDDHPARDMTDTYYLTNDLTRMLRSQTSTVQVHVMENQKPPIRIISPGRVYRNETISARSHCQFHQVEGLYIDKNVSLADMKQTLNYYARAMYGPNAKTRLRASYFPFTEPSAEMDVYWGLNNEDDYRITKGTGWLEILGCGMVDPAVLENCGIDPEVYSGFAWGMGIERQAMLKYKITDIRYFFENDIRFLSQF